jgi:hypothetical protein
MLSSQRFEILSRQICECAVRIYPSIFSYFVIRFYTFDRSGWGRGALDTIWTAHLSNFFVLIPFFIRFLSSRISSALSRGNPSWCQRCSWGATPACLLSCSSSSTSVESTSGWTSTFHLPHGCNQASPCVVVAEYQVVLWVDRLTLLEEKPLASILCVTLEWWCLRGYLYHR